MVEPQVLAQPSRPVGVQHTTTDIKNIPSTETGVGAASEIKEQPNLTATPEFERQRKKLVIVGDGTCGKTCLLIVFSKGYFPEVYVPTIFENYVADIPLAKQKTVVEMALWDTAGTLCTVI
jgi:Ras homolog gene family, member A